MATWRWGRKATFAAYSGQGRDDHGRTGRKISRQQGLHRAQRRGDVAQAAASLEDRAPALVADDVGSLRHAAAPPDLRRGHPCQDALCRGPSLSRDQFPPRTTMAAASSASNCASASWRSRMSRNGWKIWRATSRSTCRRSTGAGSCMSSHENLLPSRKMNLWRLLRFRLFQFLRLVSQPASFLLRPRQQCAADGGNLSRPPAIALASQRLSY